MEIYIAIMYGFGLVYLIVGVTKIIIKLTIQYN